MKKTALAANVGLRLALAGCLQFGFAFRKMRTTVCISVAMREALESVPEVLLCTALIWCGCARDIHMASGSRLAVAESNEEAQRLYGIKPFKQEHRSWRFEGQQWIWQALTSFGGQDMVAKVTLDERGAVASVEVAMLAHPLPVRDFDRGLEPGVERQKARPISEVMPR